METVKIQVRRVVAGGLLCGVSLAILVVFILLWVCRRVKVAEPNVAIRLFETLMSLSIFGFSVWNILKVIKGVAKEEQ